jgi:hypothetical protein
VLWVGQCCFNETAPPQLFSKIGGGAEDNLSLQKNGGMFLKDSHTDSADTPSGSLEGNQLHLLCVGWRNFFSSCAVVSVFWFLVGNRFWCYILTYLEYNAVVAVC